MPKKYNPFPDELAQTMFEKVSSIPGLDALPEPTLQTNSLKWESSLRIKHTMLDSIAWAYPFEYAAIAEFYEHYKSYDLLIAACEYCAATGSGILIMPPVPDVEIKVCPNCGITLGVAGKRRAAP